MRTFSTPASAGEWKLAVAAAAVGLLVDSAQRRGFLTGSGDFDVRGCTAVLAEGRGRGIVPEPERVLEEIEEFAAGDEMITVLLWGLYEKGREREGKDTSK